MRRIYDLNINILGLSLIPIAWRKPLLASWVQSSLQGIKHAYSAFSAWRREQNYRLYHNGQVCYLRSMLNDRFDASQRRIEVCDPDGGGSATIVYMRDTVDVLHCVIDDREIGNRIALSMRGYDGVKGVDFVVKVPKGICDEGVLASAVNTYKLASKRWTLIYT